MTAHFSRERFHSLDSVPPSGLRTRGEKGENVSMGSGERTREDPLELGKIDGGLIECDEKSERNNREETTD